MLAWPTLRSSDPVTSPASAFFSEQIWIPTLSQQLGGVITFYRTVLGTYLLTEEEHNDYSPWLACTCCTSSHAVSLGFWQNEHEYSFGSATRQFQLLLSVYILGVGGGGGGLILINDLWCGGGTVSGLRRNYCTSPHHLTSNNFTNTNLHISTVQYTVCTLVRIYFLSMLMLKKW